MLAEISLKNQTAAHKASRRALCICLLALAFGPLGACSDDNTSAPTDPFDGCEETDSCADRCQSDQDCEVGQRCEASSGQCVSAECLVDAHCGADQRCVERACQDRPDEPVDSDGDGIFDDEDNCPRALNDDQADLDGDGQGDACDGDLDGDGVLNGLDNCPVSANPMQEDPDGDGLGLVCHGGTVSVPFGVARGVVGQRLDTATRPDESSAACGGAGAPEVAFLTALHPGEELRARVEASHGLALYVLDAQGEVVACEAADALSFVAEVEGPYTLVIDGKGADDAGMIQLQLSVIGDEVAVESVDYDLEGVPGAVWAGRLNDDEYLDMVAIDTEAGQLTISLGIEGDQFAAPVTLAVEGNPVAIWGGDLNNDGADDIALALADSDQVAVFFNEGQGAEVDFSAQRNANVGDNPVAIWGGDLNNDGGIELAVVNEGSNDVSVISVGERGALIPAGRFEVGEGPVAIWGGDLNNDGHPDLATANFDGGTGSTVSVIPGTGNGLMDIGFGQAQAHEIGQGPRAIWGGDLNNDGGIELAVVHDGGTSGGLLSILPNLGAELGAPISHPIGENPVAIWGGDLNNDGHPDLATANFGDSSLSLLLGDGQGGLGEAEAVGLESPPVYIWGGDLNNDGSPDLMAPGGAALGMTMVMSRATGFSGALGDPSGGLEGIWGGDLNRDGNVDLAFVHKDNNTLMVRMGTRNGTFAAAQEFQVGQAPLFIWGGDLNRDGGADLVVANSAGPLSMNKDGEGEGSLSVLLSNPDGTLAQPVELAVDAGARTIWGDHDFNGDGLPDLAVATRDSNSVSVLLATGPGLFEDGHLSLPLGGDLNEDNQPIEAPLGIWGGDLNNDGHPDLVTAGTRSGSFSVFNGRGDGSFEEPTRVPTGGTGSATVWGDDLNGDGRVDLATNNLDDGQMAVLINGSGEGVLRLNQPELYEIGTGFGQVWGGDITNDGLPDLVTTNNDGINVFTGYNAGGFAGRQQLAVGQGAKWIWGDDFTGDGVPDIATTGDNGLEIRVGRRQSPLQAPGARPVRAQLPPCPATDLTGRINVRRGEITFNAGAFERPCQVERLEVSVEYSARLRTTSFLGDDTVITLGNANLNEDARDSVLVHSVGRIPAPGRWRPEHLPGLARFEGAPVGGVWRLKASSARCRRSDGACLPLFTRVTLHINPVPVDPFNGGGGNAFCTSGADQPDPPAQPCRWDGAALDGLIDREGDVDPLLIDGPKGGGLAAGSTVTVTLTTDSGTLPPSLSLQAFGARLPLARAAQVEEGRLELTFVVPPAFDGRYATLEISAPPGAALPLAYSIEASFE